MRGWYTQRTTCRKNCKLIKVKREKGGDKKKKHENEWKRRKKNWNDAKNSTTIEIFSPWNVIFFLFHEFQNINSYIFIWHFAFFYNRSVKNDCHSCIYPASKRESARPSERFIFRDEIWESGVMNCKICERMINLCDILVLEPAHALVSVVITLMWRCEWLWQHFVWYRARDCRQRCWFQCNVEYNLREFTTYYLLQTGANTSESR